MVAIVLGILLGVVITLLVFDVMKLRKPIVVQVEGNDKSNEKGTNDTIVKYVVHKYENHSSFYDDPLQPIDSLSKDTLDAEGISEDLTMEDASYNPEDGAVVSARVLGESKCKIVFLDNEKNEMTDHTVQTVRIQFLETPIKNKTSYLFNAGTLKIKGMPVGTTKLYHYKNTLYLVLNHHAYIITPNSQFEKMVEDKEVFGK